MLSLNECSLSHVCHSAVSLAVKGLVNGNECQLGWCAEHNAAKQIVLILFGDMNNKYGCLRVRTQKLNLDARFEPQIVWNL